MKKCIVAIACSIALVTTFSASPASAETAHSVPPPDGPKRTAAYADASVATQPFAKRPPSKTGCQGDIDYPHISRSKGVTYTINTHVIGRCKVTPSAHSVEGKLYRLRWFGQEHLKSGKRSGAKKYHQVNLNTKCKKNSKYVYRATGRFYSKVGKKTFAVSYYNQTPKKETCVKGGK